MHAEANLRECHTSHVRGGFRDRRGRGSSLLLALLILLFFVPAPPAEADDPPLGMQLLTEARGTFGALTQGMTQLLDPHRIGSGIEAAGQAAKGALEALTEGRLPVIGDLEDPFHGNVDLAIQQAVQDAEVAAGILGELVGDQAQQMLVDLSQSPLFQDVDVRLTSPVGWLRVLRDGLDVSVYATVFGPFGSRISVGVSNADPLAGMTQPRMANPLHELALFVDMAIGYSHLHMRKVLAPSLSGGLLALAPQIEAVTYLRIHDQWTQIRYASSDPGAFEVEGTISIGLKAGVRAEIMAEIGAALTLGIKLKPARAADILDGVLDEMEAAADGQDETRDVLANATDVLRAGLDHLEDLESQYPQDLGEISLNAGVTGQLGVGIWDSGLAAVSASGGLTVKLPLEALVGLAANEMEGLLDFAIGLGDTMRDLGQGLIEGIPQSEIDLIIAELRNDAESLGANALAALLQLTTALEMEAQFEVALAGETDPGSGTRETNIPLITFAVSFPLGDLAETLLDDHAAIRRAMSAAIEAGAQLMMAGYDPLSGTDIDWGELSLGVTDGIQFSLLAMGTGPVLRVGFSEMPLTDLLELMEIHANYLRPILVAVMDGGRTGSITPLRTAIENAIDQIDTLANDTFVTLLKSPRLHFEAGLGANAELGAELGIKIGGSARLEGNVKTSLLFLLLNRDEYEEEDQTQLAALSFPVSIELTGEASIGEGVELEISGGVTASTNLFDLTFTHWDGELPSPAGMTVAGFEVLEFEGVVQNDESFSGEGWLLLPMGGIVRAQFDVDAGGHVISGHWWGGFDLGPLGSITLLEGEITDAGIHGVIDIGFLVADFILKSTGWLYGTYHGDVTIAGHQFLALDLVLEESGSFAGSGLIDLFGFTATADLRVGPGGIEGNASLDLLGSTLTADDFAVSPGGGMTGTFTGSLVIGDLHVAGVSLELQPDGMRGTGVIDLPFLVHAEIDLLVQGGMLTGHYEGESPLYGTQMSSIDFTFAWDGVVIDAWLESGLLGHLNDQTQAFLNGSAQLAIDAINLAKEGLDLAQEKLDLLLEDILRVREEVIERLQAAVTAAEQGLLEAEAALDEAIAALKPLEDAFNVARQKLVNDLNQALADLDAAQREVDRWRAHLKALDDWYDGLPWYKKAGAWVGYQAQRLVRLALIEAAELTLSIAQGVVTAARNALDDFVPSAALLAKRALKAEKEKFFQAARDALAAARQALANPDGDPALAALLATKAVLDQELQDAIDWLTAVEEDFGNAAIVANYIIEFGLTRLFVVESARFHAELDTLGTSSVVSLEVTGVFMDKPFSRTFAYDLQDPEGSFEGVARQLESSAGGNIVDTIPPEVIISAPIEWQNQDVTVQLSATDNLGGTGVYTIDYSTTGAQTGSGVVLGGTGTFTVTAEGQTTVSAHATDNAGNAGVLRTRTVSLDLTAPHVELTLPADPYALPYVVTVSATDAASGMDFLWIMTTGAQPHPEAKYYGSGATVSLTNAGDTTVSVRATDKAGNTRAFEQVVTVPDTTPPEITPPPDVTAEATGVLTAVAIGMATATDDVEVASVLSDAPAVFPLGTTIVTWTAKDTSGNSASATQRVTVVDTTPPAITAPPDIEDYEATAPLSPIDIGQATATDAVGVVSIVSNAPPDYPLGTTVVVWTASDAAGNSAIALQLVTVVDTTAPTLAPIGSPTVLWPPAHKMVDVTVHPNAEDAVGPITIALEVTSDEPVEGTGDGDMAPDWGDVAIDSATGVVTLVLRAERSGQGDGRVYTLTLTATDGSGNASTASVAVTVPKSQGGGKDAGS